jgi:hypothetical protein
MFGSTICRVSRDDTNITITFLDVIHRSVFHANRTFRRMNCLYAQYLKRRF